MYSIYIVRHGQDEDNAQGILNGHRDQSLTALGRSQAIQLAKKLQGKAIGAVYCGPLRRHRETANIILEVLGTIPVTINESLIERDFGVLTGKPVDDIPKYAKEILAGDRVNYFLSVEGSESFPAVYERASTFLRNLRSQAQDKNVLVVTSSDTGKMIRAAFMGWPWQEGLMTSYFDNADSIELVVPD